MLRPTGVVALVVAALTAAGTLAAQQDHPVPLSLPHLTPQQSCPVTNGSRDIVPRLDYIFGSGRVWFGKGPAYINLAWKGDLLPPARFNFHNIPVSRGISVPAKTPITTEPGFTGTIVMQGQSLREPDVLLRFTTDSGETVHDRLELESPHGGPAPGTWSFWAIGLVIPKAGCYGVQIDTSRGSDVIVFEAAG